MRFSQAYPPAQLGMPIAGLLWSLAVLLTEWRTLAALDVQPTQTVLLVTLGGMTQILILWLGFTAVCWAMVRAFGGRISLVRLGTLVSNAAVPLWLGAPVLAFWLSGALGHDALVLLITLASLSLFAVLVGQLLSAELNWSTSRAAMAVTATLAFLASSIFLSL